MNNVEIVVVGDLVPGGTLTNKVMDPLVEADSLFNKCDLIWANLECSIPFELTPIKNRSSKVPGDIQTLFNIIQSRKFVFSMANNHAMDYDLQNLIKIKELLKKKDIETFGVGINQKEARKSYIFEINQIKIGLAAYSSDEKWVGDHLKEKPGEFISILNDKTIEEVREFSKTVDYFFVALHFGKEFVDLPVSHDREIARKLIDNGASAVFGHHPHVYQGYEVYNGKPIFYSLGNFIFPPFNEPQKLRWTVKERTGLAVKIILADKVSFKWEIIPTFYDAKSDSVKILTGNKHKNVLARLNKISVPLKLNETEYKNKFNANVKFVSAKLILRGILRNLFKPRLKHIVMFGRLTKQIFLSIPVKKST